MKLIETGKEARTKLKKGIDQVADVVKKTLGVHGRNAIVWRKNRHPKVSNDGIFIAKNCVPLKGEIENLGAESLINVAEKTNNEVGDGTTTSMVLAQAIINEVFEKTDKKETLLDGSDSLMDYYREINEVCEKVVEELKERAEEVEDIKDLERVAIIASESEKFGKKIAEMVDEVGADGFISVEDSYQQKTTTETVSGMEIYGKHAADFLVNDDKGRAVWKDSKIIVTNNEIEDRSQLMGVSQDLAKNRAESKLVIIAPDFSKAALVSIYNTIEQAGFNILAIKAKSMTTPELEDIAIYTDAAFIDKEKGEKIDDLVKENGRVDINDLGEARKVVSDGDTTMIIDGDGDKTKIEMRIENLKRERKEEKLDSFKKKIDRRIASLSEGVGIIKVGSKSDLEKIYLKLKIEDAVFATQAALEEGVVKGGGLALKEIAEEMDENVLTNSLKAPYNQIQGNAGGDLEISDDIIDPVKVTRVALENACSLAGILVTTESAINEKRQDIDELRELLK